MPNTHKTFPRPSSQDGIPHPTHEKYPSSVARRPFRRLGEDLVLAPHIMKLMIRFGLYRLRYGAKGGGYGLLTLYGPPGVGKSDTVRSAAISSSGRFEPQATRLSPIWRAFRTTG